ncbi:MAG: hypothetical protein AVDCRST_MAG65-697, partial [uncultured Solirubrobacteraceae bacterium]
ELASRRGRRLVRPVPVAAGSHAALRGADPWRPGSTALRTHPGRAGEDQLDLGDDPQVRGV